MGKLKFVCCGWEPTSGQQGSFHSEELLAMNPYYSLQISMYANAEKQNAAGKWYIETDMMKLEKFHVLVQLVEV